MDNITICWIIFFGLVLIFLGWMPICCKYLKGDDEPLLPID